MADTFRVLYADDEPDLLNIGKLFLERSGDFSVATVCSASAALELLKKEQFDAIISDYQMPGMDGIQFLIEVRKKYGSTPFILFTGKGREEVVIKALNEGADFYLQKGGDPSAQFAELINKVGYAVRRRRSETEVNEAGEKYKAFISVSNTGAWEYHADTGFLWCSPEYLSMLGRNASQFDFSGKANLQETWTDLLHPEDRERADRHFKEYLLNGSVGMYENHFRMRHSDGHWVWIWSRGSTLRNNKGDLTRKTVGTHIDITESRLAEEAIANNNERLRMAQEIGKIGSWELDLATARVWASEEGFRIFAAPRPADGVISLEEIEARIPDRERIHRALTVHVKKGKEYNLEYAIEPYDNSGQKIVHSVARILIDAEKKPAMIAGVIQDITGRKRSEEQVLLAGEEWERTFNAVPDLVSILDTEHTIRRVNKAMAAKLGVTPDEAVGLTCYQYVHGTQSPPNFCPHAMLIKDQQEHAVEIYEERLGGHFLVTCTPLWDKDGKLLGSVHIARNITDRKRAEEALLRLSQFHERVITNAQVWLSVLSDKGTILMWNTAAEEISGYRAGEVIGKNEVWKMLYPDKAYRKQITDTITRIIRDQNYLENFETTILSKSGTKKVISWNTRGIPDITGTISDFIAIGVDVTDRVRADGELKKSQVQLAGAMDLAHLANWEFDVVTGIFTFNDRFYALYGTTTEREGGNQMPADVYARQFVHPDDQHLVADEVNKAINATDPAFVSEVGHRIIRRDGEVRHIVVRFGITKDAAGKTVTTHGANQDITELKRIEELISQQTGAMEAAMDGMAILNGDQNYIYTNKAHARIYGYDSAVELLGASWGILYDTDELQRFEQEIIPELRQKGNYYGKARGKKKDGNTFPQDLSLTVLDHGGLICIVRDITDRTMADDSLLKINQKLNVLSQLTRKDLTNQVFVLNSYLELTKNQLAGQGPALETLQEVEGAVRLIHKTIEYTKDYQDMGAKPPAWQNVTLTMLLGLSHISISEIRHSIETEDLEIFADPLLEKVCQRLFENSVKHGDHVTRIRVWHTVTPEVATIFFEDDGIGIPPEKKEQIFLRSGGTSASSGSLIFVREIFDITGITIRETGEPGKGARFEMVVPKGMWRIGRNGAK